MFKIDTAMKDWEKLYKNVPIQPITNNKTKKQITEMYNRRLISKADYCDLVLNGGGKNVASTIKPLIFNQQPPAVCHTGGCGAYLAPSIDWQFVTQPLQLTEKQIVELVTTGNCTITDVNGNVKELKYEGPRMLDFQIHELDLEEDEI